MGRRWNRKDFGGYGCVARKHLSPCARHAPLYLQ
jgi:hypothetical protein